MNSKGAWTAAPCSSWHQLSLPSTHRSLALMMRYRVSELNHDIKTQEPHLAPMVKTACIMQLASQLWLNRRATLPCNGTWHSMAQHSKHVTATYARSWHSTHLRTGLFVLVKEAEVRHGMLHNTLPRYWCTTPLQGQLTRLSRRSSL